MKKNYMFTTTQIKGIVSNALIPLEITTHLMDIFDLHEPQSNVWLLLSFYPINREYISPYNQLMFTKYLINHYRTHFSCDIFRKKCSKWEYLINIVPVTNFNWPISIYNFFFFLQLLTSYQLANMNRIKYTKLHTSNKERHFHRTQIRNNRLRVSWLHPEKRILIVCRIIWHDLKY